MSPIIIFAVIGFIFTTGLFLFVPAATLASLLRIAIPAILVGVGAVLSFAGRASFGSLLIFAGIALWRKMRGVGQFGPSGPKKQAPSVSSVRSALFEMELNHKTGDMNGLILAGRFDGQTLDDLGDEDVQSLIQDVQDDPESAALLNAYLDRRFAGGREDAHFDGSTGEAGSSGSRTMSEEEAYEVLGLSPGTDASQITKAHRRLMKRAHPDSGGSTFLAAKINEAKDVLLKRHT